MAEKTSGKNPSARQDAGLGQACWHSGYMAALSVLGPTTRSLLRVLGLCLGTGCPSASQRISQPAGLSPCSRDFQRVCLKAKGTTCRQVLGLLSCPNQHLKAGSFFLRVIGPALGWASAFRSEDRTHKPEETELSSLEDRELEILSCGRWRPRVR